jgi:nitrogen regulatory protein P-II 2
MKMIEAIVQPSKMEDVKEALMGVEVVRLTYSEVQGSGCQDGDAEIHRSHQGIISFFRTIMLQIAVHDDFVEPAINAIIKAGRAVGDGGICEGRIFIRPCRCASA